MGLMFPMTGLPEKFAQIEVNKGVFIPLANILNYLNPYWLTLTLNLFIWDSFLKDIYPFRHIELVTLYSALIDVLFIIF